MALRDRGRRRVEPRRAPRPGLARRAGRFDRSRPGRPTCGSGSTTRGRRLRAAPSPAPEGLDAPRCVRRGGPPRSRRRSTRARSRRRPSPPRGTRPCATCSAPPSPPPAGRPRPLPDGRPDQVGDRGGRPSGRRPPRRRPARRRDRSIRRHGARDRPESARRARGARDRPARRAWGRGGERIFLLRGTSRWRSRARGRSRRRGRSPSTRAGDLPDRPSRRSDRPRDAGGGAPELLRERRGAALVALAWSGGRLLASRNARGG